LGTNFPLDVLEPGPPEPALDDGLGDGDAAEAVTVDAAYKTAPATPPTNIDPATAAARTALRTPFTAPSLL
jgi:hypothetical protein